MHNRGVWGDEWVCMMNWGNMMNRGSMMNWGSMVNRSCMMNGGCMMNRGSMMDWCSMMNWSCMMERSSMVYRGSMVDWGSMMDRCMVDRSCMMNRFSMMCNMMHWPMMRVSMRWNWFSIFIQLWFGVVWVLVRVCIQLIQGNSLATVNLVPKLTSKLVLVKQGTIRADKPSS